MYDHPPRPAFQKAPCWLAMPTHSGCLLALQIWDLLVQWIVDSNLKFRCLQTMFCSDFELCPSSKLSRNRLHISRSFPTTWVPMVI